MSDSNNLKIVQCDDGLYAFSVKEMNSLAKDFVEKQTMLIQQCDDGNEVAIESYNRLVDILLMKYFNESNCLRKQFDSLVNKWIQQNDG